MARIRRRARKIFKLVTGDGKTFTILDWEKDAQTGRDVFHVKSGGAGFLLALGATVFGALIGYFAGNDPMYAFFGGFGGFVATIALVVFLNVGSTMKTVSFPLGAAMFPSQESMMSGKSTAAYVPNYDKHGGKIDSNTSPLAMAMRENENLERLVLSMTDQINTLYYNLKEGQKTPKEMLDDLAGGLEKLGRAAAQFKPSYADRAPAAPQQPVIRKEDDLQ